VVKIRGSQRSYLGVNIDEITPDRANALKLKDVRGVEVTMVDRDAAAGKAGLREHDVIMSYNGTPVEGEDQLRRMIRETPPGHTVQMGIVRGGNQLTVPVTMGTHAPEQAQVMAFSVPEVEVPEIEMPEMPDFPQFEVMTRSYAPTTGIAVESLTPQLAEFFGSKSRDGILIRSVDKGSIAEKAGLRAGDVIVKVSGEKVTDRGDYRRALRNKSGNVPVTILRDKREQTLTMNLPERKHSQAFPKQNFEVEVPDVNIDMDDFRPELQHIAMLSRDKSLQEFAKHKDEIQKEMKKAQEELRRSLQTMNEDSDKE
jgi:C-terminal processing protease CtpA/Prc